jgi:hypothetical protein
MVGCTEPFVPQMVRELQNACSGADLQVCLPYQLAVFVAHEKTGIPYVA